MNRSSSASVNVKAEARRLRGELAARGLTLGHSESLELLARTRGFRDWNTLSAHLLRSSSATAPPEAPLTGVGASQQPFTPAGPTVLAAQGVVKRLGSRGRNVTIGPIDLDFPAGTLTALVGRSGCGKSTVLNCLAGLQRPTEGSVIFNGQDVTRMSDQRLARIRRESFGFVFQDYTLIDALDADENIQLPAILSRRRSDPARLARVTSDLGLGDRLDANVMHLSGGERQRVAIARAITNGAQVLFCDEPTGALDPITRDVVFQAIEAARSEGVECVLLATHDVSLAARADRVVVLHAGRVVDELSSPTAREVTEAMRAAGGDQ